MTSVLAAAVAAALLVPPRARARSGEVRERRPAAHEGLLRRHRLLCSVLAGAGVATVVGGSAGLVGAAVGAVAAWVAIGRAESPQERRRRAEVRRDLPAVVTLVAAALRSGAAPADAVVLVAASLPGAAADRLAPVAARLRLGVPDVSVWADLVRDPELAPLGRTLARAHDTGASVVAAVERLADDLASAARSSVEDRARAIGVKAAVPLGLCLLPSFVLIGIVPLVAGLVSTMGWS
ncbi:type II secretion system F family protein [Nocardioides dongxiaopingii]|uniref:type II secretion system F family protein n=1 Tax=Nocardioides dongxiaopingii TaxID=2576036 RepID=UPI001FECC0A2|nr:type II secretion system F family protein [Nocardioides dongxiaopingii]